MSSQQKRVLLNQQTGSNKSRYSYHYDAHIINATQRRRPIPPTSLHPIIASKPKQRPPPKAAETYDNLLPDIQANLELPTQQFESRLVAYKTAYAPIKNDDDAQVKKRLQDYYQFNQKYGSGTDWGAKEEEEVIESLEYLTNVGSSYHGISGGIYKKAGICIGSGRTANAIRVHVKSLASQKNKNHLLHSRASAVCKKLHKTQATTANDTC